MEMTFEEKHKQIRNVIVKCEREHLLIEIVSHLRQWDRMSFKDAINNKIELPWPLLYLLKMAVLYAGQNNKKVIVSSNTLIDIYNKVWNLTGEYNAFVFKEFGQSSFFTLVALYEFWYQNEFSKYDIARINYLYCGLSETAVGERITEKLSMSLVDFIDLFMSLYYYVKECPNQLIFDLNSILQSKYYDKDTVISFLNTIGGDAKQIKERIRVSKKSVKTIFLQFGEQSPFVRTPLIKLDNGQYIVVGNKILERSLFITIFDLLRSYCNDTEIKNFSNRFEDYIEQLLKVSKVKYQSERELQSIYSGKATDFLVINKDVAIMLEAKSVILKELTRAYPRKDNIVNELQDNVIKAIFQGHELSTKVNANNLISHFFLLIITYDDIFLGKPQDAWDHYYGEYCEMQFRLFAQKKGLLQPENIFVISIREFELLCSALASGIDLSSFLLNAVADNKHYHSSCFCLSLHLSRLNKTPEMSFINTEFNDLNSRIRKKIQI